MNWNVPAGMTIIDGQGTSYLTVFIDSTFTDGDLTADISNSCGSRPFLIHLSTVPVAIDSIFGDSTDICTTSNTNYFQVEGADGSENFTWTAPATRVGKISLYAAGNGANGDGSPGGDNIYTSSTGTLSGTGISNFANDLKSDLAVYRPSQGIWYSYNLDDGTFKIVNWGLATDKIAPGDYDGDGVTDYAVFRPSNGNWYLFQSTAGISGATWGLSGDVPAAADYDGDGKTDIAIFRPSNGVWYILKSTGGFTIVNWGLAEDRPVPGDYDADGKTDIAVFRPSSGVWYVLKSTGGFSFNAFGTTGDKPVQADYDGDGITDMAIYRPSTGHWWLWRSTLGITAIGLGLATDIPAPADFDGDGSTDLAVFRPSSGTWIFRRSSDNAVVNGAWGTDGDRPVANGYIPE